MAEEQTYLLNANVPAQQMLRHIDEAFAVSDVEEVREHVQQTLDAAQDYAEELDGAFGITEAPDLSDLIEECMRHLDMVIEHGEAALDAPDEDVEEYLSAMLRHAQQSYAYLQEAVSSVR